MAKTGVMRDPGLLRPILELSPGYLDAAFDEVWRQPVAHVEVGHAVRDHNDGPAVVREVTHLLHDRLVEPWVQAGRGLSRNSSDGLVSSSRATLTRLSWPPDSLSARVCPCLVSASSLMTSSTRAFRSQACVSGGKRSSATYRSAGSVVRWVWMMLSCGIRPIRVRSSA